jgi:hypothetical protein
VYMWLQALYILLILDEIPYHIIEMARVKIGNSFLVSEYILKFID